MRLSKRLFSAFLIAGLLFSGCGAQNTANDGNTGKEEETVPKTEESVAETGLNKIDMTKWQYHEDNDVYWQVGIVYCENPADVFYENLGIFVPGAYLTGTQNSDGTYTCEINVEASVADYTAQTAPIVIPVETPGYSAMSAPTGYLESTSAYTDEGFVYVYAGCRGRDAGAPAGVTDLKAAIRYVRYNDDIMPGNAERIFTFGMSGGGAQSALVGATGDSDLYTPYLEEIGAVSNVSDAVFGAMCWCPITNLDYASEAYEWNLGVTRTDLTDDMQKLSDSMAEQFALYINELGLRDGDGNPLFLEVSEEGIYQAGSYYEYLKSVIETSLNHFLADTEFPYTASGNAGMGGRPNMGDFGGMEGGPDMGDFGDMKGGPDGGFGRDGGMKPDRGGNHGDFDAPDGNMTNFYERDGIERNEVKGGITVSGTYETAEDYIAALNAEREWIAYDSTTNTAFITSVADFVSALKQASKDLGAFDALDKSQGENILFGYGDGSGAHFDAVMASLLTGTEYEEAYAEDLDRMDSLGYSVEYRSNMYNPLYYLCDYYDGAGTSTVASCWRIRSGINQSDTALTTEMNLALALEQYGVNVDFETVWGQGHAEAERTGSSTTNFIEWVKECMDLPE